MAKLETNYLGLKLKNPIIAASCGLTDSVEKIMDLEKAGAAAVVMKSLFEEEIIMEMEDAMRDMVSRPFVYPETFDYMEHVEDSEDSIRRFLGVLKKSKKKVNIPIIASINCVTAQKWLYISQEMEKAGADAIELNLFILPTDLNRNILDNEKLYFDIVKLLKEKVDIPISLKISFYSSNLSGMIQSLDNIGIEGLVLFNRFYNIDFDIDSLETTNQSVMSQPTDYSLPLRWISIMSERVNCSLAASTGVHNAETLIKMLLAGADAVQIATVLYKNGLDFIKTLLSGLEDWMSQHNYKSVQEFKGKMSQNRSGNPAVYERIQFMKEFRNFVLNK